MTDDDRASMTINNHSSITKEKEQHTRTTVSEVVDAFVTPIFGICVVDGCSIEIASSVTPNFRETA
jgi:hypothetical protein